MAQSWDVFLTQFVAPFKCSSEKSIQVVYTGSLKVKRHTQKMLYKNAASSVNHAKLV